MIDVRDVTVRYGDVGVLDGVSLTVDRGQFVGLVGPNGAGKTTLLRTTNGVLDPDSGRVTVDGRDVHDVSSRAASRLVATVPQDTSLAFDFDVRDAVAMGRTPHRSRFERATETDREAVERALERTDTARFADRPVGAVSGGERQRVLLARALAQDTPVLLLDEPTSSLDINHQVNTLELVADLVAAGKTVVAAIHDLDLAARYCDAVALLSDGQLLAAGPPSDVLTADRLGDAFDTRAVVGTNPVTGTPAVTALPETAIAGTDGGRSPRVHVLGGGATAARLLSDLAAAGVDPTVGPLPRGDAALSTARELDVETVTVERFAPLDERTVAETVDRLRAADATVVAGALGDRAAPLFDAVRESDAPVVAVGEIPSTLAEHARAIDVDGAATAVVDAIGERRVDEERAETESGR